MKGQSGVEFIVLLGFLMLVFLGFSMVIQDQIVQQQQANQRDLSLQLADLVEREILLAARVNPGYSREFELPITLGNEGYNISLEDKNTLVIERGGEEYIRFLNVNVTLNKTGIAAADDFRLVDFTTGHREIFIQKNTWGRLYIHRACVEGNVALHNCPVCDLETCP